MNESGPNKTTSTRSFDEWLEDLGIFENGKPAPGIEPLFSSCRTQQVGWLWQSADIATEWIGPDGADTTYWNSVRLALRDHGIVICGYSFTYTDLDNPLTTYFSWNVFWKQTDTRALHKQAIEHASRPLRSYNSGQLTNLVHNWGRVKPWFVFDLATEDRPRVTFRGEWLQKFLKRTAVDMLARPKTKPKDRKPYPRILKAIYALDPSGLVEAICTVVPEHPDFEDIIRELVPEAFHAAALDKSKLSTADELANEFGRSKRTILRIAKHLKRKPRIGKYGLYRFSQRDAIRILDWINAERKRT